MAGQFSYGGSVFDDNSPWKAGYDMQGNAIDVGKTQMFNYDDLMKGTYNYDDLINNVYRSDSGVSNDQGAINYNAWTPNAQNDIGGAGVLNGLGFVTGSGYTTSDKYLGNDQGAMNYQTSYSNPTSLFIDNALKGSSTEANNYNYNVTRDPVTGKAIASKIARYEPLMKDAGAAWKVAAMIASAWAGGGMGLGGAEGAAGTGAFDMAGASGAGMGFSGAEAAAAGIGGASGAGAGALGEGSFMGGGSGGGFGGYGGTSAMDTGAFDLGGTFGGTAGSGGYSSGLADLFGSGSVTGDFLSSGLQYVDPETTGAFDLGGTYGGSSGAGGFTGDYFGSGLLGDFGGTGAFDQTGSQGAGLGFGGSGSEYGLSNLYSDAKYYGDKLSNINNATKDYTGQSVSQLGRGLYDAYAKNQVSKSAGSRADQLQGLFGNSSPYAQQLAKQLAVRDAAAGRNSQYGPREVELQAKLAELQAGVLNSKNYNDLRNTQTNSKLGMFNTLVANTAANTIAKNTPALVSSALSSISKFIGF